MEGEIFRFRFPSLRPPFTIGANVFSQLLSVSVKYNNKAELTVGDVYSEYTTAATAPGLYTGI